ncbi:MAG: carbonic anhydrase [Chlamydiia bacterium]|nr:carbonic anhydrase [Chlamydiia bacterium]
MNKLLEKNRHWAAKKLGEDPQFFKRHVEGQSPKILWIGCSDSRIFAIQTMELGPGEVFVHRNIANLCPETDKSSRAVLEFAVTHLGAEHVIVCGHYGCGGIAAAMDEKKLPIIEEWIEPIRALYKEKEEELSRLSTLDERHDRLVELNVIAQVRSISTSPTAENARAQSKFLKIHGWVYDLATGLLKDLDCS